MDKVTILHPDPECDLCRDPDGNGPAMVLCSTHFVLAGKEIESDTNIHVLTDNSAGL